jgi:hypothetical protein
MQMKSVYVDRNVAATRERKYEVLDSKSETEQAGYIPPQIQIENMILAGERLNQSRKEMYDFSSPDEIDEDAFDPTRRGNFDLADASQMAMETEMSLRDQALEADKLRKAAQAEIEASGEVKKGSKGVSEPPPEKGA